MWAIILGKLMRVTKWRGTKPFRFGKESSICDVCHRRAYAAKRNIAEVNCERVFFVTSVTAKRQPFFRLEATARLLIETIAFYRDAGKYLLHEFVVMPDHLHLLLAPADEIALERAIQFIKGGFSFRLKSRWAVWQDGFTNHRVRDLMDYEIHREYIRMNPVRARLVGRAEEYPYCSAAGVLGLDALPQGLKPRSSDLALTRP